MFDKNQRSKLSENKEALIDVSSGVEIAFDPVKRYNFVVEQYNADQNRVGIIHYQKMKDYCLFRSMFKIIENKIYLMFYTLALLIPFFGSLLYLLLLIAFVEFHLNLAIFRKNKRSLSDPFRNMILCPKLCVEEKVINKYYDINVNELARFDLDEEFKKDLKSRENRGTISFMVYNSRFRDYYNNFPSLKIPFTLTMFFGLICVVIQGYIISNVL